MAWLLFAEELSGWGAAAVGSLVSAAIFALGTFAAKWFRARGGYAKDVASAAVAVSDADRKARREQEDAERRTRRDEEDAERRQESAILKEYKQLVKEQEADRRQDRGEVHKLRDQLQAVSTKLAVCETKLAVCEVECGRRDQRIAALEAAAGLRGDGSGSHRPLGDGL